MINTEKYKVHKRVQKYVKVNDDWYPNFNGNEVLVTLTLFGGYVKFNAWGMDDTGVEMECPVHSEVVFDTWEKYIFDRIPYVVNRKWFLEHGFYPA